MNTVRDISERRQTEETPRVRMPLDLAVPRGLIINELVINSLNYPFPKGLTSPEGGRHEVDQRQETRFTLTFTLRIRTQAND